MTEALLAISAALAFGLAVAVYVLMTSRRKAEPEFDGGFRHNHPRVTTTIYTGGAVPKFIHTKGND